MPLVVPRVLHKEMNPILHYSVLLLLPTIILLHLYCSPYTKVEESFNIQATHDILTYGIPFSDSETKLATNYDHVSFPGSVPRTFVGAIFLAEVARPWKRWLPAPHHGQYLVRAILGLTNAGAMLLFRNAVNQAFGRTAATWYILLQASQFHVTYYASRTLPNMFAFALTTIAARNIILSSFGPRKRRARRCQIGLCLLTFAGIVFRSEIAVLLAMQTAHLVFVRRFSLKHVVVPAGIAAMAISLLLTVGVDSFFWQNFPLWPEWVAFRYNAIEGKSAEWGTSPFYFYFLDSLPRLLLNPMAFGVCIALALLEKSTRRFSIDMLLPLMAYITVLSILPHKEWRFIIYTVPPLTAVSSCGASTIWQRRSRSVIYRLLAIGLILSTLASLLLSAVFSVISSYNYPGADALTQLHNIADGERPMIRLHIENLSAQTGVTRFLEKPAPSGLEDLNGTTVWYYDKTEDPSLLDSARFWERFDYVLADQPALRQGAWEIVETVCAYDGIELRAREMFPRGCDEEQVQMDRNRQDDVWQNLRGYWKAVEAWMRKNVTQGWWPGIRTRPRVYILKKQEA